MNNALAELYGYDNLIRLADKDSGFNHSIWDRVVKWLHSKRGYEIDDKPVKDLINETYRVLSEGVNSAITEEVPAEQILFVCIFTNQNGLPLKRYIKV